MLTLAGPHFIPPPAHLTAPCWCVVINSDTAELSALVLHVMPMRDACRKPSDMQHHSPSPHCMSASQRAANAHTPRSWETSGVKISIVWKNTYGCCRNEYDLWQVVWVCLKSSAHFKNQALIWFMLLETILQSNLLYFFVPAGQRVHRYTRKQQSSVRFCLQVESKGNCSPDNSLKGSLKHSVLF